MCDNPSVMTIRFNPIRDTVSSLIGFASGGLGLGGTLAKKLFIADDSSMLKKIGVGALATFLTAGTGLLPYLVAGPGAKHELADAKSSIVDNRY